MPKGSQSGGKEKEKKKEEKGTWVIEENKEWLPKPEFWDGLSSIL